MFLLLAFIQIAQPSFEVASVRVNPRGSAGGEGRERESIVASPGSLTMTNVTLNSCLRWAYGVRDFQISGAPGWFDTERYDIAARPSGPVSGREMKTMVQTLLAERFHLALRRQKKDLPVYALVAGKNGPKLRASSAEGPGGMRPGDGNLIFQKISMQEFADRLSARPFSLDRPVIDRTDLNGTYDFELKLADNATELKHSLERNDGPSISEVVQQQLGLKLEPQKSPLDFLVIEHAGKIPVAN